MKTLTGPDAEFGRYSGFGASDELDDASHHGEQRLSPLVASAPACIFNTVLHGNSATILGTNQGAEQAYGYTQEEFLGKQIGSLLAEDSLPTVATIIRRVRQGETVTASTTHLRSDGTHFPVRLIAASIPGDAPGRMMIAVEPIDGEMVRGIEERAIDAERSRIAHEIHDGVAQRLGALRFRSALWHGLADADHAGIHVALEELQQELAAAIADIRGAIFALRPAALDGVDLLPALSQWLSDFGVQNELTVRLDPPKLHGKMPPSYELPLFRIIQECLSNIRQHARASVVQVTLVVDAAGGVAVTVRDDGQGFDPGTSDKTRRCDHFGLLHMRERARALGGVVQVLSRIGQGTSVLITLPPVVGAMKETAQSALAHRETYRRQADPDRGGLRHVERP